MTVNAYQRLVTDRTIAGKTTGATTVRTTACRVAAVVLTVVALLTGAAGIRPASAAPVVSDPNSTSVLVNKSRPLNPLRHVPGDLVVFPGSDFAMRGTVSTQLQGLFAGARGAGHTLSVVSAYRSFDTQASLYDYYVAIYGQATADSLSARPGYSEHQTGLAVDVGNADGSCGLGACFGNTPGGRWVAANAYKYGFIIRYPDGHQATTGYTYEPWHLRYVGRTLAADMKTRSIPTLEQYFNGTNPSVPSGTDLLAVDRAGTLWNYRPNWSGGFLPRKAIGSGWQGLKAGFAADWNGDGYLDLVAQWTSGKLTLYPGKAAGGFAAPVTIGNGWQSYEITLDRWNNNQRLPSIVAKDSAGNLWHYPNTSGKALAPRIRIGSGWQHLSITMADFDRDGRQDILGRKPDGGLLLYRSDGNGRFIGEARRTIGSGWQSVDALRPVAGFQGPGTFGLTARLGNGTLAYYPISRSGWGERSMIGSGWQDYRIFR